MENSAISQGSLWKVAGTLLAGGLVAIAVSKMYNRATRKRDEQNDQEVQRVEPSSRRGSTITLSSTSASGGQQSQKQQNNTQQTLIIIQPEAIYRRKIGDIIRRFERKGYQLIALKMVKAPIPETLPLQQIIQQQTAKTSATLSTGSNSSSSTTTSRRSFESMYTHYHPQHYQQQQHAFRHQFHTPFHDTVPPIPCVVVMVWQGVDIIHFTNHMVKLRTPATFQTDFMEEEDSTAVDGGERFLYCSEDEERARTDVAYWFKDDELLAITQPSTKL